MEHGTEHSEERVRLYYGLSREQHVHSMGWGIVYDGRFKSDEWPRTAYSLSENDLGAVLEKLARLRNQKNAAELRADRYAEELHELRAKLRPYEEQRVREILMQFPEGRELLIKKDEAEAEMAREAEAAYWAQMPTTTEEETAGE